MHEERKSEKRHRDENTRCILLDVYNDCGIIRSTSLAGSTKLKQY